MQKSFCYCLTSFFLFLFTQPINALIFGPLNGSLFESGKSSNPIHRSFLYELHVPIKYKTGTAEVVLDTPSGAILLFTEERPEFIEVIDQTTEERKTLHIQEGSDLGYEVDLSDLTPGKYLFKFHGVMSDRLNCIVSQPESPLILALQVSPLMVRSGHDLEITAFFQDKIPVKSATLTATLSRGGERNFISKGDGTYQLNFVGPAFEKPIEEIDVNVVAVGERADGSPFKRERMVSFKVLTPITKIAPEIFVNEAGDMDITLFPIEGKAPFRLDVYYGSQGKKIAWAREDFILADEKKTIFIPRPGIARASDRALLKLINLNTFGVEDERLIPMPSDPIATKQVPNTVRSLLTLPDKKRKALE